MNKLLAFHSDVKLKNMLVKEIESHRKADQIIKGAYDAADADAAYARKKHFSLIAEKLISLLKEAK